MLTKVLYIAVDGVVGPVTCTKEAGTLSIPFKHAEGYKTCVFMIDSKGYSSKEKQEGNIMVESNTTFCTLFIKHFSLKTYEHITVSVDADLDRILGPITFGKLLMDKHAGTCICYIFSFIDTILCFNIGYLNVRYNIYTW